MHWDTAFSPRYSGGKEGHGLISAESLSITVHLFGLKVQEAPDILSKLSIAALHIGEGIPQPTTIVTCPSYII